MTLLRTLTGSPSLPPSYRRHAGRAMKLFAKFIGHQPKASEVTDDILLAFRSHVQKQSCGNTATTLASMVRAVARLARPEDFATRRTVKRGTWPNAELAKKHAGTIRDIAETLAAERIIYAYGCRAMRAALDQFGKFLGREAEPQTVTDGKLNKFLRWQQDRGRPAGGASNDVAIIRALAKLTCPEALPGYRRKGSSGPPAPTSHVLNAAQVGKLPTALRVKLVDYLAESYLLDRSLRDDSAYQLRHSLARFGDFLQRPAVVADLKDGTVSEFIRDAERRYSLGTVKNMRGNLLTVWKHLAEFGDDNVPFPRRVRTVKVPRKMPAAWPPETVAALVAACSRLAEPRGLYFEALINAAWDTGLRRSDLWALELSDIRPDGSVSVLQTKTQHAIHVRLRPATVNLLRAIGTDAPLAWQGAERMYYLWFDKLKALAGVSDDGYTQKVRRSSATNVELHHPQRAGRFLGHLTPGLAERHYIDRTLAMGETLQPEALETT